MCDIFKFGNKLIKGQKKKKQTGNGRRLECSMKDKNQEDLLEKRAKVKHKENKRKIKR